MQGLEYESLTDIYHLNSELPEFQTCRPLRNVQLLQSRLCPPAHSVLPISSDRTELNKPADGQSGFLSTFIGSIITQSLSARITESNGHDSVLIWVTDLHVFYFSWFFRYCIVAMWAMLVESREWIFLTVLEQSNKAAGPQKQHEASPSLRVRNLEG